MRAGEERRYPPERRKAMAAILRGQAERWGLLDASRDALEKFARPETLAVVSGQQPGLFGGPLYTIYKAATAVAFAAELERVTKRPVVPVFWIASDDHDFEEVRHVFLGDGTVEARELAYSLEAAPRGVAVSRVPLADPVLTLIAETDEALAKSDFRTDVVEALRRSYAPRSGWTEAFARLAGGWVAPWGALIFDPAEREAKRLALPVFEREIELRGRSAEAARKTGEELVAAGYHAQIARTGKELNLFWHREVREALRLSADGTFRLAESGRQIQAQELLQKLRERPEDASPGVLLRPLMQDYLFPTAAYVGGPSEVAYWAQVLAQYPLFDATPPAVVPRGGATILEPKVSKVLERYGISWEALAGDVEVVLVGDLRQLRGEREGVGRILEQGIGQHLHFVEHHVFLELLEPEGERVGDEMNLVPPLRELHAQFGRDDARAAMRRITGDSDLHDVILPDEPGRGAPALPRGS